MAASMQRWAITPPAFDGDPNETEEIPLVDAPHGTMTHGSVSQSSGTLPPGPTPDVEVTFASDEWLERTHDTLPTPVPDEITRLRFSGEADDEPRDTIPAPPRWADSEPPSKAG